MTPKLNLLDDSHMFSNLSFLILKAIVNYYNPPLYITLSPLPFMASKRKLCHSICFVLMQLSLTPSLFPWNNVTGEKYRTMIITSMRLLKLLTTLHISGQSLTSFSGWLLLTFPLFRHSTLILHFISLTNKIKTENTHTLSHHTHLWTDNCF